MRGLTILSIIFFLFLPSPTFGQSEDESFLVYFDSFQEIAFSLNVAKLNNNLEESNTSNTTSLMNSQEGSKGLSTLNQASGSLNNQSNMAMVTFAPAKGFLKIQGVSFGETIGNTITYSGAISRESHIENSFNNSQGLCMVNQSPGNLNNQSNLFIFSMDSALILGDDDLAQHTGENLIDYTAATVEKKDIVKDSFSGATGVGIISQSSGDLNAIRNTVGISFSRETIQ